MLYYCKGTDIVVAVHNDDQIAIDPVTAYGFGTYVIADFNGRAPARDQATGKYIFPTITPQMQAASVKLECRRRILISISEQSQRNINSYVTDLQTKSMLGTALTPEEISDVQTSQAINVWIGRPDGMQGASDELIAAGDPEWWADGKWPAWNPAWDSFVARF